MLAEMFGNWFSATGAVFTAGVCLFALVLGDRYQRAVAAAALAAWIGTLIVLNRDDLISPQAGVFGVDLLLMLFLAFVAVRSRASWAMWATAFQLLGVLSHLTIALDLRIRVLAYLTALALWSFLVLATLLAGVLTHVRAGQKSKQQVALGK